MASNMKLSILYFSMFLSACSGLPRDFSIVGYSEEDVGSNDRLVDLFESWASRHGRTYGSFREKMARFEIFKDNLKHIDETNRKEEGAGSYWLALNGFADVSHEEFKRRYLGLRSRGPPLRRRGSGSSFKYGGLDIVELPKSVDWRKKGAVTHVKDQGQCGSCWAFSTVAAVEGINQIVTGNLTSLSEQELVDCNSENNGCNGGLMDNAFSFITSNGGLHTEDDYPYVMEEGTCDEKRGELEVVTITGYEDVPENDEESLMKALAHQPVSVAIEASGRDFQFYSGGVFDGTCGTELDHGVAAVGYGSSKGQDYIIVRNSWGPRWGEKGYIRMKRKTGKAEGLCGINKMASYPTKDV
ncbi:cysteine protease XCP1-like [Iris pallida]|uniref:Cysteine protease XCP1-like n=1 Tax=Iris pallida TaxID=29817 RepID=A0AAX6E7I3_IRIPA|nr:cysteine protease XCP1-like [Iris pallida]